VALAGPGRLEQKRHVPVTGVGDRQVIGEVAIEPERGRRHRAVSHLDALASAEVLATVVDQQRHVIGAAVGDRQVESPVIVDTDRRDRGGLVANADLLIDPHLTGRFVGEDEYRDGIRAPVGHGDDLLRTARVEVDHVDRFLTNRQFLDLLEIRDRMGIPGVEPHHRDVVGSAVGDEPGALVEGVRGHRLGSDRRRGDGVTAVADRGLNVREGVLDFVGDRQAGKVGRQEDLREQG